MSQPNFQAEELLDVLGQRVINFSVAGDCLFLSGCRIAIDVMAGTMAVEHTARRFQVPDEFAPPHSAISFIW
jgi:hypothetical protein